MEEGEGGVYVALSGISTDSMETILSKLNLDYDVKKGKAWTYITFPEQSSLAHFFFIDYHFEWQDPTQLLTHQNEVAEIIEIHVEGNAHLIQFFKGIGLETFDEHEDSIRTTSFSTSTGKIVVTPKQKVDSRPRIRGISFGKGNTALIKWSF